MLNTEYMKSSFPKCYKSILIVFIQGRYRWRHDLVLRKLAEVTESCRQEANSRPSAPTRRPILFARAGENINHRHQRTTPRVLSPGSEGNMRVDLGRQLQFPREIVETSLRPDLITWSEPCKTILLVELTVPWEEGMEAANERKRAKQGSKLRPFWSHMLPKCNLCDSKIYLGAFVRVQIISVVRPLQFSAKRSRITAQHVPRDRELKQVKLFIRALV